MRLHLTVFCIILIMFSIACAGDKIDMKEKENKYRQEREKMVTQQIERRGVKDPLVLNAMKQVKRHLFVPEERQDFAYGDYPLPIGHQQTISQPYIVAVMTELLELKPDSKVLEIGTGSGYQAAVLAEIAQEVYTIEIVEPLCKKAEKFLKKLDYNNVRVKCADGYRGWKEAAPFDAIIITAAPPRVPEPLVKQLKPGGRLVLPVGDYWQELVIIRKTETGTKRERLFGVRFVPMTGEIQKVD